MSNSRINIKITVGSNTDFTSPHDVEYTKEITATPSEHTDAVLIVPDSLGVVPQKPSGATTIYVENLENEAEKFISFGYSDKDGALTVRINPGEFYLFTGLSTGSVVLTANSGQTAKCRVIIF